MRQRIRRHLNPDRTRLVRNATFEMEVGPGAVVGLKLAAFLACIRIVDPAVYILGEESHPIGLARLRTCSSLTAMLELLRLPDRLP